MLSTSQIRSLITEDTTGKAFSDSATETRRLREIARDHEVCYEVFPEWSIAEGRKLKIGFELELCGVNRHALDHECHPVPGCAYCSKTYDEMQNIAAWILPKEERPSRYEIEPFDRALHIAPAKRSRRSEVVLRIVIMHRRDFNRPVDDCEDRCLTEMRQRLSALGIRQDVWREDKGARRIES
jgi:hypothetical protein